MTSATVPAPESKSVSLRSPITVRDEQGHVARTIAELVLRRPIAGDLRPLPMRVLESENGRKTGATWGDMVQIIAACTGNTVQELDPMAAIDTLEAVGALNEFLAVDMDQARLKRLERRPDGGAIFTLARPLEIGSTRLERLELVPCTARHLRDIPLQPCIGDLLSLAGFLSSQAPAFIDRLDVDDALPLVELASSFFADARKAGG